MLANVYGPYWWYRRYRRHQWWYPWWYYYPPPYSYPPPPSPPSPEEELRALEEYKRELEEELKAVEARIQELRSQLPSQPPTAPPPAQTLRVAVPSEGPGGLDDTVSIRFARCPTFTIVDLKEGKVQNVQVVANPAAQLPHGAGPAVVQHLMQYGVTHVVAVQLGPNAAAALQQLGIRVVQVPQGTRVRDALTHVK